MNLDDFQKSWQSQDAAANISINADVLLNEVRRKQQCFRRTIFWRDVREVGIAILLVPVFIFFGLKISWTLHLCAFGCVVVGGYFLFDRWRQKKKTPDLHGSLKDCATTSLAEVSHQIWLLKNIVWWYLLPFFVPMLLFFGAAGWSAHGPVVAKLFGLLVVLFPTVFVTVLYAGVYWLNQYTVKKCLEPRRQELEKLLDGLESGKHSASAPTKKPFGPLLLVLAACAIAVLAHPITKIKPATPTVPALAAVVTKGGQICDRSAAGVRKWDEPTLITANDVFHIGGCTKSMTATLAAMIIEQGELRWETTIAEVFPELKGKMDRQYETVTVEQLLHDCGGVPTEPTAAAWERAREEIGTPTQQRREFIEAVLSVPPASAPGTKAIYSNQGYAIVGAMLEKITGRDFETLMTEKLFKPLHMDSAGFGAPGTKDKTDQPWGHIVGEWSMPIPVQTDNPPALSPAARVHCSLDDLARYAMFHLQRGTNGLLKPETMARLHASLAGMEINNQIENHACGWVRLERGWAGGTVLWHDGSNRLWYLVMWLAPEKDFSVIVATNIAGEEAEKACDAMATAMIQKWLPGK